MLGFGPAAAARPPIRATPYGNGITSQGGAGSIDIQPEERDRVVYVGNLAYTVTWQDLLEHMSQAGTVDRARILTEDGTENGRSRGTGYVCYASAQEAENAIALLKETDLQGRNILVDVWDANNKSSQKGKGKNFGCQNFGFGKGASFKGIPAQLPPASLPPSGVACASAVASVLGLRLPLQPAGLPPKPQIIGDPNKLVYVGNLAYSVKWQDLKEHMAQAGTVEFSKVLTEDGTDSGRSRGTGCVRFSTEQEAAYAISILGETELQGRRILVDRWHKDGGRPL